jgi:oligopeptide transport system substrate-binding protein
MKKNTAALMALLLITGCGEQDKTDQTTESGEIYGGDSGIELAKEQVFRKNNGAEPGTLDPHRAEGVPASNILRDLFEGLVVELPNGEYIPGVAESWTVSEDSKRYVFKIRKNAKWSNGDAFTAYDYVYSFKRSVDPKTLSNYSSMLYPIKNARAIVMGEASPEQLGVYSEDENTLVVELEKPTPYFLSLLTHSTTYPVHRESIEKLGKLFTRPGNLVSNGAFKLEEWRVQSHIKIIKNEQYWDNENTTLEATYYYSLDDANSALKRYRANELDFTDTIPLEQLTLIKNRMAGEYRVAPYFGSYYYGFNNTKAPFKNNPKLRTALNMAIDRDILVNIVIGAGQIPAYSFVPPVKTFQPIEPEWSTWSKEKREAEALRLYQEAGYSKDKPLEVEILYNTSENHKKVALAVAAMWKQALGAKTILRNQEWKVFLDTRRMQNETQIFRGGWIGDYDDPYTFSQMLHAENEMNHPGYNSKEYNRLVDLAATKNAGEDRLNDLRAAERVLTKDLPIIPLYFYVSQHMVKPWVIGLEDNVMDHHYSKYVKILKREKRQQK